MGWLDNILNPQINRTGSVQPAGKVDYGSGSQPVAGNEEADPRKAGKHSTGVHGAVSGTGSNGAHLVNYYA